MPFDLSPVANEIKSELQSAAPEREVNWVIASGLFVEADPDLMRIVLFNLLGNAWKFTGKTKTGKDRTWLQKN